MAYCLSRAVSKFFLSLLGLDGLFLLKIFFATCVISCTDILVFLFVCSFVSRVQHVERVIAGSNLGNVKRMLLHRIPSLKWFASAYQCFTFSSLQELRTVDLQNS